jgi:UDP-N-acetylmuramoyl-L-alanyl-D-glutamate--2,6-diaminopimelate ligase
MNLRQLIDAIAGATPTTTHGPLDTEITSLTANSRDAIAGSLFVAIRGEKVDGHRYISKALDAGSTAIMAEDDSPPDFPHAWIRVTDSRRAIAAAANLFYGEPSNDLVNVGATGTNGKTTSAFILQHVLNRAMGRCGLIGTVAYDTGMGAGPASHTTPDWIALPRLLSEMRDHGCRAVAMEVSSHALQQSRVSATRFDAAIFTNLTQDHLDYHGDMEKYFAAKGQFFEHLTTQGGKKKPHAILNGDDAYGRRLARQYENRLPIVTYGMGINCDFRGSDVRTSVKGTTFKLTARGRDFLVKLPLIGRFNVMNALGALAAAWSVDCNLREAVASLAETPQVPGRMQSVGEAKPFRVFVDYAHTPDALENALQTLRDLEPRGIITIFGCGGDRDRTKRPLMGAVAERLSTRTILTSDNPRSEDPEAILAEIRQGIRGENVETIADRRTAIARGIELARGGDIVLVAGKGHEQGQICADEVLPFDDVKEVQRVLQNWTLPERG